MFQNTFFYGKQQFMGKYSGALLSFWRIVQLVKAFITLFYKGNFDNGAKTIHVEPTTDGRIGLEDDSNSILYRRLLMYFLLRMLLCNF